MIPLSHSQKYDTLDMIIISRNKLRYSRYNIDRAPADIDTHSNRACYVYYI